MPAKVANDAERDLYLTPGGRYTAADIEANGNVTASQKFKGLKSEHDMKPKVGDMLCPISGTKANSKFTWIIDGKLTSFAVLPAWMSFWHLPKLLRNRFQIQKALSRSRLCCPPRKFD